MTDEMRAREEAICKAAKVSSVGDVSDGFHTFNGLYKQRMILFAALVKAHKNKAWKSYRHEDGEFCFGGGWFIVGIDTPAGSYTYHYENKYWDMFDCVDLPRGKHWDGHTEADAEARLLSLAAGYDWIPCSERLPTDPMRQEWESRMFLVCLLNIDSSEPEDPPFPFVYKTIELDHYDGPEEGGWRVGDYKNEKNAFEARVIAWMPLPEPYEG